MNTQHIFFSEVNPLHINYANNLYTVLQIEVNKWENDTKTVFHEFPYFVLRKVNPNFQIIYFAPYRFSEVNFWPIYRPSLNIIKTLTNFKIVFTLNLQTHMQLLVHTTLSR